jgi:hypothetical protein
MLRSRGVSVTFAGDAPAPARSSRARTPRSCHGGSPAADGNETYSCAASLPSRAPVFSTAQLTTTLGASLAASIASAE